MAEARYHDDDLHFLRLIMEIIFHFEAVADDGKAILQCGQARARLTLEADTHEEITGFLIVELGAVGDVASIVRKKAGNGRNDAARRPAFDGKGKGLHFRWTFLMPVSCNSTGLVS